MWIFKGNVLKSIRYMLRYVIYPIYMSNACILHMNKYANNICKHVIHYSYTHTNIFLMQKFKEVKEMNVYGQVILSRFKHKAQT